MSLRGLTLAEEGRYSKGSPAGAIQAGGFPFAAVGGAGRPGASHDRPGPSGAGNSIDLTPNGSQQLYLRTSSDQIQWSTDNATWMNSGVNTDADASIGLGNFDTVYLEVFHRAGKQHHLRRHHHRRRSSGAAGGRRSQTISKSKEMSRPTAATSRSSSCRKSTFHRRRDLDQEHRRVDRPAQ